MRVVALALAALLIVISGFWLARERSAGRQAASDSTTQSASAAPSTDSTGAEAAGPEVADGAIAVTGSAGSLPEGFTAVTPLTDEPKRVFDAAGDVLEDGVDYIAAIQTNRGTFLVDLFEDQTPVTVNNFVFLALNLYYDGVPFHRVIEGFMAQTGDPTGTGTGGPGYQFQDEIVSTLTFDSAGLVAMANAGPGTNGSQFFITFDATAWLNGGHTIFGRLLEGESLLPSITRVDPQSPSAVVYLDSPLSELADQGVNLPGNANDTVASVVEQELGTMPVMGQSFTVAGYRGAMGQVGGTPAFGFFAQPDSIERVIIATRPR